jgi:hypothetical protein
MEVQASQIFTTGQLSLAGPGGVVYTETFGALGGHFINAGVAWNAGGAVPITNIVALCDLVRNDGLTEPRRILMGEGSFEAAMNIANVSARFNLLNAKIGEINPMQIDSRGGQLRGYIEIGAVRLDIWTYGAQYRDPATGNLVKYLPDASIVVMGDGRFDTTFGGIPSFGTDKRALKYLPGRLGVAEKGMDLQMNSWVSPDGESLHIGVGARPFLIPTQINCFAHMNTGI